ncbi:MAG: protein kinase domain-containing protein [Planctomycetota bacterium]
MADADATLRPGEDPLIGSVIAGFQVIEKLGEGAMGVVYLANQVSLDRNIALKILPPNPALMQGDNITRFMREARTAASLSHVNIVQVHDAGEYEGLYFIAMEYVRGMGLSEVLGGIKVLGETAGLEIALQTAQGLGAAADRGVIHRDIKPANLMLTEDVTVKVADFGLAKALDSKAGGGLTATGKIVGTPSYMSPEQAESKPTDLRSDIFSLGVTLFETVTGTKPFVADSIVGVLREVVDTPAPDPREFKEDLCEDTAKTILRMLEKDPNDRYPTYTELIQDLLMAKRSLPKKGGYLDSVKVFIMNDLKTREALAEGTAGVGSAAATMKFGPSVITRPSPREPSIPGLPPRPVVEEKKSSAKPLILGSLAGGVLLTGALLAFLFLSGYFGSREALLPAGGMTSFNLEVTNPDEGAVFPPGKVQIEGNFSGKSPDKILVQGEPAWIGEGKFRAEVTLSKTGDVSVAIAATSLDGGEETSTLRMRIDDTPPLLEFEKRVRDGRITVKDRQFAIGGRLVDPNPQEVLVDGTPLKLKASGAFLFTSTKEGEGSTEYVFVGKDKAGHSVTKKVVVRRDSTPPQLRIENLPRAVLSIIPEVGFNVTVSEPLGRLLVNDQEVALTTAKAGTHAVRAPLKKGTNTITVVAEDRAGHRVSEVGQVVFQDLRTVEGKEEEDRVYRELKTDLGLVKPTLQLELLRKFLKEYPESQHAPEIEGKIEAVTLLAEEEAWQRVIDSATGTLTERVEALRAYLESFPKGRHRDVAESDLAFFERLESSPVELQKGEDSAWVNPRDGAELTKIPRSRYTLSGDPKRRVWLDAFYLYRTEVTQAQFLTFLNSVNSLQDERGRPFLARTGSAGMETYDWGIVRREGKWVAPEGMENHPVVFVTWYGATAYARWAGGVLPSEAQWEAAANPTGANRVYAWGNSMTGVYAWYQRNSEGKLQPVRTRTVPLIEVYDLNGNVWEWCRDNFDATFPNRAEALEDNVVCLEPSALRSVRGGGWNSHAKHLRLDARAGVNPLHAGPAVGFRVVIPAK